MFLYKKPQSKADVIVPKGEHEQQSVQKELEMVRKKLVTSQKVLKGTREELEAEHVRFQASNVNHAGTNPPSSGSKPFVVPSFQLSEKIRKRFRFWPFGKR